MYQKKTFLGNVIGAFATKLSNELSGGKVFWCRIQTVPRLSYRCILSAFREQLRACMEDIRERAGGQSNFSPAANERELRL